MSLFYSEYRDLTLKSYVDETQDNLLIDTLRKPVLGVFLISYV